MKRRMTGWRVSILLLGTTVWWCGAETAHSAMDDGHGGVARPALALELDGEGRWAEAALEFRRAAMAEEAAGSAESRVRAAGWWWQAAYDYARAKQDAASERMLDRAEDAEEDAVALPVAWLRAENAMRGEEWASATFHFDGLRLRAGDDAEWRAYAARGKAAARLRDADAEGAAMALAECGVESAEATAALAGYVAGRDRLPWLGGVLGLVPGLGYAYSGEYANALRSLILNSLFIWAMVETAQEDDWAVFTVCAFLETTWYSGSIYGGVDAAHRYNARRLETAVKGIRGPASVVPDAAVLPVVALRFRF